VRLQSDVDVTDPVWREQVFFTRLPAALSAVFQEEELADCREQIEAQAAKLVPCKRARVILKPGAETRRKSGVARLSVPLFAHGRVLGTLALDRRERWSSPRERELVRSFAELAAQALYALTVRCELYELARTDPLTGVGNRRRLVEELERLIDLGGGFRMLFVDVDGLKAVNDKLGFEKGDRLIVALADALCSKRKSGEVVARLGGDEFVVVLPGLSKKQARKRARRFEERIERLPVSRRIRRYFHGASTGIVKVRPGESALEVLGRGERAMRREKQRRRALSASNGSLGRLQSRVIR
jgi:diguanylate cyclase (GGDEF)-like protein